MSNTDVSPPPPPQIVNPFAKVIDLARQGLGMQSRLTPPQAAPPPPEQAPSPPQFQLPPVRQAQPPAPPIPSPQTVQSSFIPPRSDRPPGQIGKPWWPVEAANRSPGPAPESQFIPSPRDAHRYLAQASAQNAQDGPPSVAGPARQVSMLAAGFAPLFDLLSQGAFSRGFSEGNALQIQKKLGALKVEQEQFVLQSEIMQQAQQKLLLQYDDVLDAASGPNPRLSPQQAEQMIAQIAAMNNDPGTQAAISMGGLRTAMGHIQRLDARLRTTMAGTTALKKMTEGEKTDAQEQAAYGYKTDISGQGFGASPSFNIPDQDGGAQQAAAEPEGTPAAETSEFEKEQEKRGNTPDVIRDGRAAYNGDFDPKVLKSEAIRTRVNGVAADLGAEINRIATGPGDTNSKLQQIEDRDPTTASRLRGLLDLHLDPEKDIPATHNARERMTTLAHAINPNWKTDQFQLARQYELQNQPSVRTVQRVSALVSAASSLDNSLLSVPADQKIATSTLKKVYANTWTGDPTYNRIYTNIQNVLNETAAIQSGTGRPAVSNVRARAQEMLNTMSPAQIQVQLQADMEASYGMINSIKDQYKQTVGDPHAQLPFFPKQSEADYRSILRSNPFTGEMPADASDTLLAGSRKGGARPSWLNTNQNDPNYQAWKPLTEAQVTEGRRQIRENLNSSDPKVQAAIQTIRRRLGVFATPEPGDPDYGQQPQQQQSVAR